MSFPESTVPLDDEYRDTLEYCGRTFHKYSLETGTYFAPVDEEEVERLELMHNVLSKVFDNRLIFPPMAAPRSILDCGCGSANWAVDVAEKHPDCEGLHTTTEIAAAIATNGSVFLLMLERFANVLGIDVSPHMLPEHSPRNLDFQIDDLNARFDRKNPVGCCNRWLTVEAGLRFREIRSILFTARWLLEGYVRDIYRVTKPGGWCQIVELYLNAQSDNGRLTYSEWIRRFHCREWKAAKRCGCADHALSKWSSRYLNTLSPRKNPRAALHMAGWMESAGFVDIESKLITLPMSDWPTEARDQRIGRANRENVKELLETAALYPLTEQTKMPMEEFEQLISMARDEAGDPGLKVGR
ncbi:Methyltransferase type 11 [Cordyceps militaris]|uniref:Methyltransferase type 11 n=1 Tax=Cordyceps militaris TaxID=73501 RepID=A0A2H4SAQ8_CORMI|nr:Methyltransferase type 11 [Cordyceps militaris]